jgi:hypothetical protein
MISQQSSKRCEGVHSERSATFTFLKSIIKRVSKTGCTDGSNGGSGHNGFQEGKRGRSLAMHPFTSFGRLLTNHYRHFFPMRIMSQEYEMSLITDNMNINKDPNSDRDSEYLLI